jgi:predicted peptidase
MQHRSRGLYDVGLSEGAAVALALRGERPDDWTCVELVGAGDRLMCVTMMRKADVASPDTVAGFFNWLAPRDVFLRVG